MTQKNDCISSAASGRKRRVKSRDLVLAVSVAGLVVQMDAAAQLPVSTFEAADAHACFMAAGEIGVGDLENCDAALENAELQQSDRAVTFVNRGILKNRAGDWAQAIPDFNAALEINESLGEAYLNRGNSHFLMDNDEEALADYKMAISVGVEQVFAAWYNIGLVHEHRDEKEEAIAAFEKALEANADFLLAMEKLGR